MSIESATIGVAATLLGMATQEERLKYVPLFIVNCILGRLLIWMGYHLYCRN